MDGGKSGDGGRVQKGERRERPYGRQMSSVADIKKSPKLMLEALKMAAKQSYLLGAKVFYVLAAVRAATDSRGALTPSNVHRTFSVRLNRFTSRCKQYTSVPSVQRQQRGRVQTF